MIRLSLLLGLLCCCYFAVAQQPVSVQSVSRKVPPILRSDVHYYAGLIDDIFQVQLNLGCKGQQCKGEFLYTKSNTSFQVEGQLHGNQLLLHELDQNKATTGFIKATLTDTEIKGEWSNFDGTIGSRLYLQKIEDNKTLPNVQAQKWVNIYKGIILWDEVRLLVHHLGHQQLQGKIYYRTQDEAFPLTGTLTDAGTMHLTIKNEAGDIIGTIIENGRTEKSFRAEYLDKNGKKHFSSFALKETIDVGQVRYADYCVSYEILYPVLLQSAFNAWMQKYLLDWKNACRQQVKAFHNKHIVQKPHTRAVERAYVWFEMETLNDNIVSGYSFFSNTWETQTQGKSLNFDKTTSKEIRAKDIFRKRKKKAFEKFKQQYIATQLRRHPRYMESGFREWVQAADFPLFAIRKDGIRFSTDYHDLYGNVTVRIPYSELRPFMKKKTVINRYY